MTARSAATVQWNGATRWVAGAGAIEEVLQQAPLGDRPVVVFDPGAVATPSGRRLLTRVRGGLAHPPVAEHPVPGPATVSVLAELNARWCAAGATGVVAVGGGCTLDVAMLATLPANVLSANQLRRGRCGLVVLRPAAVASVPTVAIPTTLGTGAEVSAAACCEREDDGKVLVLGDALRPAFAAVDPVATESLPARFVRAAVVEVLARVLVPFCAAPVGQPAVVALADAVSLASLDRLAAVGCQADATTAAGRLAIASLSAHSHTGWGSLGRTPDCHPVWPLATELATLTGWTKSEATACLLPAWARAVLCDDDDGPGTAIGWGKAGRLRTAWRQFGRPIGFGTGELSDPASGLAALMQRLLGSDRPVPEADDDQCHALASAVAIRAARRWGTGVPVLRRVHTDDIAELVYDGLASRRADLPVAGPVAT
jgi:alcohol dehydrogenase